MEKSKRRDQQMAGADVEYEMATRTGWDDEHLLEDIKVPKDEASHNEEEFSKILELLDPSGQPQFWKDVRKRFWA